MLAAVLWNNTDYVTDVCVSVKALYRCYKFILIEILATKL